jgi:hypothetical protein
MLYHATIENKAKSQRTTIIRYRNNIFHSIENLKNTFNAKLISKAERRERERHKRERPYRDIH